MSESTPVAVKDLHVAFGNFQILRGVNAVIERGESVAILGSNGSGKTTFVRAMLGIVPATGYIELFGQPLAKRSRVDWDRIGYVPQRVTAASGVPATALEVVRSGLVGAGHMWGDLGKNAKKKAMDALDAVGLADRANDHVQVFSGGQSQRVLIARALVRHPELLVLDEPLAGIDRTSRIGLAEILTTLSANGTTLVTVLHEMGELTDVVKRAIVINEGLVTHDGVPPHAAPGECIDHDHQHPHTSPEPAPHHAPSLRLEIK